MAKLVKISGRTLGILLEWLLIIIIALAFAIRTSPVQTYLAQQATSYLSEELNTTVKINKVSIIFFDEVALDGFLILDQQGDSLFAAETVFATIDEMKLSENYYKIGKVRLDGGYGHIQKNKAGEINMQFITDYFASEEKKESKNIEFAITSVELNDSRFIYDDHRRAKKTFGVDYSHLDARNINGTISDISIQNQDIKANIQDLNADEKSGFILKTLSAEADVSNAGIFLTNLHLKSPKSSIHAPKFNLKTNSYSDLTSFADSVTFDAKISESIVSMEDVALFGRALEGMDEEVRLKTDIAEKVNNLLLTNVDIRIKEKTKLQGTLNLVDFTDLENAIFEEKIHYAYVDLDELEKIKMPKSTSTDYLIMDERVKRLNYFEADEVTVAGRYSQFILDANYIKTALGGISTQNGILFTQNKENDSFFFSKSAGSAYDVKVDRFNLGSFLANSSLGEVDGTMSVSGEAFSFSKILFNDISGNINRFDLMNYAYSNIKIDKGTFKNNIFYANVSINDPNLTLDFVGGIDLNGSQNMSFEANLSEAVLDRLGFTNTPSSLATTMKVDMTGTNPNNYEGNVFVDCFSYVENGKEINVPMMTLDITRSEAIDSFTVTSDIADIGIQGKIDFDYVWMHINDEMSEILPAIYTESRENLEHHLEDFFAFQVDLKDANDFLNIFAPSLKISSGTTLRGDYSAVNTEFNARVNAAALEYKDMVFTDVVLNQTIESDKLNLTYHVDEFKYNDSLSFNDLYFTTIGGNNDLVSEFSWDQETPNASTIKWETYAKDVDHFNFLIQPSYFSIKERKWEITDASNFKIKADTIQVEKFLLKRNDQSIKLWGQISKQDNDQLNYDIKNLQLAEISEFVTDAVNLEGELISYGYIANPNENLQHSGTTLIRGFFVDEQEVGDVYLTSIWDQPKKAINLKGDLMYKGLKNFNLEGQYYTDRETENLDFELTFDKTDIKFSNAFMDPDVLGDIHGFLDGKILLTGSPSSPQLEGTIDLKEGGANVALLGADFGFSGPIYIDPDGFYINGIPVTDEEGNTGSLIGSVYHSNFEDFDFDLHFNLEDDFGKRDPIQPWKAVPLERFIVMNSEYKPGEVYYGKAYIRGSANIFGYTDNLEITVDMESQRGTKINFPMYGAGEIDEEYDFIEFIDHSVAAAPKDPKINFSGVHLDLNFMATPEAEMKIIFNEELGDIITATGNGEISVILDNFGDIKMDGAYTIANGVYDFAMGPIKQKFFIQEGGTIGWTGSPYDANLDVQTYQRINANIAELSADKFGSTNAHEEIQCYLNLNETLLKPAIKFDIKAPNANERGKTLINRVKSDNDELNRQFFSLMLWRKFQPLAGEGAAGGSAAIDLVTNQINSLLSKVSSDYALNVNLDNDEVTGDNSFEFGVKRGFLDDRLLVSGSFGVEGHENADGEFIGDLNLEYLLNESGTFKINIFNESNAKSVIQNQAQGHFTQGAGLHYQEDFNKVDDFKMVQYFLDIFRKKENKRYPIKRKRRQVIVPPKDEVSPTAATPSG